MTTQLNIRYLANFLVEADTPLKIGSGDAGLLTDALIMTDSNGLPLILGTSLCGVLRHSLLNSEVSSNDIDCIFGYQNDKSDDGAGSRLVVSNAYFITNANNAIEGFSRINWQEEFFSRFKALPLRQHAKITHQGVADKENHGKFDEQVIYKGTRFRFEFELTGTMQDKDNWEKMLEQISRPDFRIGGGTRKGFGKLKVLEIRSKIIDLKHDMDIYLSKTASVNDVSIYDKAQKPENLKSGHWKKYTLTLKPENTWLFGSGLGDEEVDMTPVYEDIIKWDDKNKPGFDKKKILIPATSVKGAISHRVAYHYNKINGVFADEVNNISDFTGENNVAVKTLFGCAKNSKKQIDGQRGHVIISDVFIQNEKTEKIMNHVAIDRFTGGALSGALFDEKVITQKNEIVLEFLLNTKQEAVDEEMIQAFESALDDITNGQLPLGGGTMRGHGCFTGKMEVSYE